MTDYGSGELLLLNKPLGWTSYDVVNKIKLLLKKKYGKKFKVGHSGTLDPLATGLLIICTGSFTKKFNELQDLEKEYEGVFTLGAFRPSFDKETAIIETFPVNHISNDMIEQAAKNFTGEIEQVPPLHSAIMVDGVRAYKIARRGEKVELLPRKVFISSFEVRRLDETHIGFRVICSKGTYVRSLARDFGKYLNSSTYIDTLIRTRIGNYFLKDAMQAEDIQYHYFNKQEY